MFYEKYIESNKAWIDETFAKLDKKLSYTAVKSRDKIPYTTDENGVHDDHSGNPFMWTNGFWGGLMWIMYESTKNEEYKKTALRSEELMDKAFSDVQKLHHDVGFMWHLLSGASYRLTGNQASRNRNLIAAMTLASRYKENGGYIRAWNGKWGGRDNDGWTIIDCMMNLPLLYWASSELGDDRFTQIAMAHADMTIRDHVRDDGSVNHIVVHDTVTGEAVETLGGQGYGIGSSWSRGTAWGLYGFTLSYVHTAEKRYLDTAKQIAHYFISNVAGTDYLPLVDFRAPDEPILHDSTAGAIAACGLIEIAKQVPEHEQRPYLAAAIKILKAMEEKFCNWEENEDSILQMGTEMYTRGIHKPIIYGDYFFAEAIAKLRGSEFNPWLK